MHPELRERLGHPVTRELLVRQDPRDSQGTQDQQGLQDQLVLPVLRERLVQVVE